MIRGFWRLLAGVFCVGLLVGVGYADSLYGGRRIVTWLAPGGVPVPAVEGELLVKFKPGTTRVRVSNLHRAVSAVVVKTIPHIDVSLVRLPEGMSLEEGLTAYQGRPEVLFAEVNGIYYPPPTVPNDPYYSQQHYLPLVKAPEAWDITTGSPDVVIADIDVGVMVDHPDLKDNIWVNPGEIAGNGIDDDRNGYVDDINGWDFVQDDGDVSPIDNVRARAALSARAGPEPAPQAGFAPPPFAWVDRATDHGTYCSGIAAATGNNGVGVAGMCWSAKIMVGRIYDMQEVATAERLAEALTYAASNGAKVGNLEIAGPIDSQAVHQAVDFAVWRDVVVVAAAHNYNLDLNVTPWYPIGYDGVIGVAATRADDRKSDFSNYGFGVDICAPGGNTDPPETMLGLGYYDPDDPDFGEPYALGGGTSAATPLVAGAAALIRALNPDLTRVEVEKALLDGADNIDAQNPEYLGKLGRGRLNVLRSVLPARPGPPKISIFFPSPSAISYSVTPAVWGQVRPLSVRAPAVDADSVVIKVDGAQVFSSATDAGFDRQTGELLVSLRALAQGAHIFSVEASDVEGRAADPVSVAFRVETYLLGSGPQMFSVPYLLTRADPATVLGASSPRLARWEPDVQYHTWQAGTTDPFVASVSPGKAYWVQNAQETPLRVEGGTVGFRNFTFQEEYQGTEQDPLRPGWHQIGTPFPFATSAGSLLFESDNVRLPAGQAVAAGWVARTLYWYTSRGYDWLALEDATMQPFVGYWMRTLVPCRVIMPPVGTRSSRSAEPTGGRASQGGWQAALTVEAGQYVDAANIFGVAPAASDGRGIWDVEKPPTPGVSAGFVRGGDLYAQQLLPEAGETKSWDLVVRTALEDETVSIAWGDLRSVPRDVSVVFTDLATNKRVLMRTSGGYTYKTGSEGGERRFRITAQKVGAGLRLGAVEVQRVRAGGASISVSVTQPALVTVEIVGLNGALLRRVAEREAVAGGAATFYWDGRDEQGTLVPAGSYLCEVRAETEEGERVSAVTSFVLVP